MKYKMDCFIDYFYPWSARDGLIMSYFFLFSQGPKGEKGMKGERVSWPRFL